MSPYYAGLRSAMGSARLLVPSVVALIHDERGRLLLVRKQDGSWSLPAGAIEPGESPEAAVRREAVEETGFVCSQVVLCAALGGEDFQHRYPNGHEVEYVLLVYRCQGRRQTAPSDVEEVAATAYFSADDLPALSLPYPKSLLFPAG